MKIMGDTEPLPYYCPKSPELKYKKTMNRRFILLFALCGFILLGKAQVVNVSLVSDVDKRNVPVIGTMERNLAALLTEINRADAQKSTLNTSSLPMSQFAKDGLLMLWSNASFYCDEPFIVERVWDFGDYFMVRHIPILLVPRESNDKSEKYQEVVVEFSTDGTITDFMFSSDLQIGESMEHGGEAVDLERRMVILSYCDRFRTAYNTKDLNFIRKVFSEDALIITGSVVSTKSYDGTPLTSIKYKKQDKERYIANLEHCFKANQWINVKFYEIGGGGEKGGMPCVTRSTENPNFYGVRLRQEWRSSNYSDNGYIFLLWDFTDENAPIIHVRTWQPALVGGSPLPDEEIFSLSDFEGL